MPPHRLSVDTLADFEFMNAAYSHLEKYNLPFDLPHVVELMNNKPELKEINSHVHQCRLVEDKKRVLFVVDAGGEFGYGHLTRCMELARQLTERLAWSTHFFVDDRQATAIVRQMGFTIHWGAFARPVNQDGNQPPVALASISRQYDLLVIDIFDQRGPDAGWRSCFDKNIGCVVMENSLRWASEADMIVQPNLLDKRPDWLSSETASSDRKLGCKKKAEDHRRGRLHHIEKQNQTSGFTTGREKVRCPWYICTTASDVKRSAPSLRG